MTLTIGDGKLLAEGSALITVTHTPSGRTATVPIASSNGSNIPDPTTNQLVRVSAADYAGDDTALRADMWVGSGQTAYYDDATKAPTGANSSVRFPFMTCGDLITLDAVNMWRGKPTFRQRFPHGSAATAESISPTLAHDSIADMEQIWIKQVIRIDPTDTSGVPFFYGTGAGGVGYKLLSFGFNNYNGRYEIEWENGNTTNAQLGPASSPVNASSQRVCDQTWDDLGNTQWINSLSMTAPFNDGLFYALIGGVFKIDANTQRVAWWYGPDDGSAPMTKLYDQTYTLKSAYQGTVGLYMGLPQIKAYNVFGLTCNQVRSNTNDVYINRADTVLFDPAVVADPWGVLNTHGVTISSVTPSTLARGVTNQLVTITGTNIDPNCLAIFSNAGITSTPNFAYNKSSRTKLVLSVSVDAGATPGAGTVQVTSSTEPESGTLAFTVT